MGKIETTSGNSKVLNQQSRLAQHDAYFCQVLDLIHPSIYIRDEARDNEKYYKNKKKKTPQHEKKMKNKLLKKEKFNPANMKSNAELQKEIVEKKTKERDERRKQILRDMQKYGHEDDEDNEDDEVDDDKEEKEGGMEEENSSFGNNKAGDDNSTTVTATDEMDESSDSDSDDTKKEKIKKNDEKERKERKERKEWVFSLLYYLCRLNR